MPRQLDEKPLSAKLFSIEMVITMAVFVVSLSGVWFGLVFRVDASDLVIKEMQKEQKTQASDIQEIKTSNELILYRMNLAEQRSKEQSVKLKEMLDILRERQR